MVQALVDGLAGTAFDTLVDWYSTSDTVTLEQFCDNLISKEDRMMQPKLLTGVEGHEVGAAALEGKSVLQIGHNQANHPAPYCPKLARVQSQYKEDWKMSLLQQNRSLGTRVPRQKAITTAAEPCATSTAEQLAITGKPTRLRFKPRQLHQWIWWWRTFVWQRQ
jgi:hypothetical protein